MHQSVSFDPFRFESATGRLWCGTQEVRLTPKAAAVLGALIAHAGEPVSKQALFASVWRDSVVSDDALISCIQELRKALADDPKQPRFIETRHRRGYRFVAPVSQPTVPAADLPNKAEKDALVAEKGTDVSGKHFYKSAAADNAEAQRFFRRAIELDPTLAQAYAWLSYAQVMGMVYFDAEPDEERLNQAVAIARTGVELDEQDAMTHFTCGRALLARKAYT